MVFKYITWCTQTPKMWKKLWYYFIINFYQCNITITILDFSLSFLLELLILIVFVKICLLLFLVVLFLLSFCYCPKFKRERTRGMSSRGAYAPDESNQGEGICVFPPPPSLNMPMIKFEKSTTDENSSHRANRGLTSKQVSL